VIIRMLENNFAANFKKWIPHEAVDEVYDVAKIGFGGEEGFGLHHRAICRCQRQSLDCDTRRCDCL
jgi:hypothetical protein